MASEHPGTGVCLLRERRTPSRNRHGRIPRHWSRSGRGYRTLGLRVVATSRSIAPSNDEHVLAIAGDIRDRATAQRVVAAAKQRFGRVDTLVNNAGIFIAKPQWTGSKVTGKHDGGFGTFNGTVDVVDGVPEKSKVDVSIDADSLTTDIERLTGHLKSSDFFDTKANPKATFVTKETKKGGDQGATHTVTGDLTIKGITKTVTFPATISLNGDTTNVDAEFAINRREFSLNYPGKPNDLIRDDVVIKLTIRAKKAS